MIYEKKHQIKKNKQVCYFTNMELLNAKDYWG